eukprot:2173546-Amphidinium_carterae.2
MSSSVGMVVMVREHSLMETSSSGHTVTLPGQLAEAADCRHHLYKSLQVRQKSGFRQSVARHSAWVMNEAHMQVRVGVASVVATCTTVVHSANEMIGLHIEVFVLQCPAKQPLARNCVGAHG